MRDPMRVCFSIPRLSNLRFKSISLSYFLLFWTTDVTCKISVGFLSRSLAKFE